MDVLLFGIGRWQVVWNWRGWRNGTATPLYGEHDHTAGLNYRLWWFGPIEVWRHGD